MQKPVLRLEEAFDAYKEWDINGEKVTITVERV